MIQYPDPKQIEYTGITIHQRNRIVIQQFDDKAVAETITKLKDLGIPCDHEGFIAYVSEGTGELLGEVVVTRKFHGVAFAPVEESA